DADSDADTDPTGDLIFSEISDSDSNAKFVEVYNAGPTTVDLTGWTIERYANGSTSSTAFDLSGTLASGEMLVLVQSVNSFQSMYGFAPDGDDAFVFANNGDDVLELRDGGALVDIIGVVGQSSGAWDYTDSSARRNAGVTSGSTTWQAGEWTIDDWNNATPGVR
ncbi:MAG: lamin tail domain-containing protein, partial [Myxococcales bacterium]|nr:lamin tail domain-containing protein [Myxococcales bacterium]